MARDAVKKLAGHDQFFVVLMSMYYAIQAKVLCNLFLEEKLSSQQKDIRNRKSILKNKFIFVYCKQRG